MRGPKFADQRRIGNGSPTVPRITNQIEGNDIDLDQTGNSDPMSKNVSFGNGLGQRDLKSGRFISGNSGGGRPIAQLILCNDLTIGGVYAMKLPSAKTTRLDLSPGRSAHWVRVKNPKAPAVEREAEEDWGR